LLGHLQQDVARHSSRWSRAVALLCVLLTLFFATAQVLHVHNGSKTSIDRDCSICSVAHSTAQVAAVFQYAPVFGRTSFITAIKESLHSFLTVSCLFSRPPPSV
jgi:hypothetical protein